MANVSGMSDSCKTSESSSNNSEEVESSEDNCNGESKSKQDISKDSMASSKCANIKNTPNSFCLRSSKLNPSLGSLPSTPSKPFVLNPPRLSNPFSKIEKEDEAKTEDVCSTPKMSQEKKEERLFTPLNKSSVSFLPLGGEATTTPSQPTSFTAASTPSLGFVFGQNIHEKVEAATPAENSSVAAAEPSPSKDTTEVTTNGTSSEMLFSVQVPKENCEKANEGSKSLSEAAREYEEARAVKRKYEEVPVLTGEEEEANVLQKSMHSNKDRKAPLKQKCGTSVFSCGEIKGEKKEDYFELFGKIVAAKLRSLNDHQRIFAERLISETLFEAELGSLSRASRITKETLSVASSSTSNQISQPFKLGQATLCQNFSKFPWK